jgi:hypothetical protein
MQPRTGRLMWKLFEAQIGATEPGATLTVEVLKSKRSFMSL